jgi:hypothetical protein
MTNRGEVGWMVLMGLGQGGNKINLKSWKECLAPWDVFSGLFWFVFVFDKS